MLLGIDHLVIAVADPDAAAAELEMKLGLLPGGGGRHDLLGTFNRLVWLGDSYLELIGVFDREAASGSWIGAPTLRALEAGGGLATWAIASDDLAADVAMLQERGSTLAEPIDGERVRPDGRVVRWRLSAAQPLAADRPPFLIEHDPAAAEWSPSDRAERAPGPARLDVLELGVDDLDRTSQALLRTTGLRFRPSLSGGGARDVDIGTQRVRLRPARDRSKPRTTIHLWTRQDLSSDVGALGCRWILRPQPGTGSG